VVIDTVVKVGGSLLRLGRAPLARLLAHLADVARMVPVLVVPGGAVFDDAVREATHQHRIGDDAAHWMAILAMDAYGWLLADLAPACVPLHNLAQARRAARSGRLPVLLPFALMRARDELPHTWAVTSDSIAVWVAGMVGARRVILLKDVAGIYTTAPGHCPSPALLAQVDADTAAASGAVDPYLPQALARFFPLGECWVTGGTQPSAVVALVLTGTPEGTRVVQGSQQRPASV